jgi:hypothetical protein
MPNFNESSYKTIDYNNIIVNLPSKDIPKTNITRQQNNNNNIKDYYKILYTSENAAFQTSLLRSNSFKSSNIYIYGLLHNNIINMTNTSNTDIVGELVIEHNDNDTKLFTCFLLKKKIDPSAPAIKTENPNKIDDIISYISNCVATTSTCSNVKLTSVLFNNVLSSSTSINNKFIYYKDENDNNIIIFLTPIDITYQEYIGFISNLSNSTSLFNINPSYAVTNAVTNAVNNDTTTNDDILDCELVGVGTDKTPIDNFSINQLTNELNRNIDLIRIGIYFFALIVLLMIAYTIVPYLFGLIINKSGNAVENNKKITSTFVIYSIFIVIYVFLLFHIGFKKNDTTILFVGFITVLIYVLSILVIVTQNKDFTFSFNYSTFETLICECVKFTIKNVIPKYIGLFIITIILIAIILTIRKENLKKKYGDAVVLGSIYIIPITIILSIVSYSPGDSKDSSCTTA